MIVDMKNATYLEHVVSALTAGKTFPQMTNVCPECNEALEFFNTRDHIVFNAATDEDPEKIVIVIGCEGYWMIDPNLVGIVSDGWLTIDAMIEDMNNPPVVDANVSEHATADPKFNATIDMPW